MFKLAERRGAAEGLYCGREGLFLGPIALIVKIGSVYQLRRTDAAADLLTEAYGAEHDPAALLARLPMICQALQEASSAER